jgi:predicted amidohydrolase YtcJ
MRDSRAQIVHGVPVFIRPGAPPVDAIGFVDGVVTATGPLAAVTAAMPPETTVRTLDGGAVLPAFTDPHQHAYLVAADPETDALYRRAADVRGLLALVRTLAASGRSARPGEGPWLRFHGYEAMRLTERRSPTAAELDAAVNDRPLHVLSRTYHESAVNSAGLDALGIGRQTPDPLGGRIMRDRRGNPTGVLLEAASFAAEAASRAPDATDPAAWSERLRAHGRRLLSLGITRIADAAVPAEVADAFVAELAAVGVTAHPLLIGPRIDEPALVAGRTAKVLLDGGEYPHLCMTGGQVAAVLRGSFRANMGKERDLARAVGTRAGMPKKERDGRWHTGIRLRHEARLGALLREAADTGSGLAFHAVGNGSVEALLSTLEADPVLAAAVPVRVEHAMTLDRNLSERLARLGLAVIAQPGFITAFGHELASVPMPTPIALMPFRSMLDAGVPLAFSSDYPAAELSPWAAITAAVTRRDGEGVVIGANEALDLVAALDAATRGAARALGPGAPAGTGTLEPGAPADLAWLDRNPYAVSVAELARIGVLATWSVGTLVHEATG